MAEAAGWGQFKLVGSYVLSTHKLYRSSAPNYNESVGDTSQKLTKLAVDYLTHRDRNITRIISFNHVKYNATELALLKTAEITYLHLPVADFTAATEAQLNQAIAFYSKSPNANTLIHCGFGHGRTGTGVTACQLSVTKGANPVESKWKSDNYVETDAQVAVLRKIRDKYKTEL